MDQADRLGARFTWVGADEPISGWWAWLVSVAMSGTRIRTALTRSLVAGGVLVWSMPSGASADPKDTSQLRTMICDNGRTVEAIIQRSNTSTLHITTTTENFVVKRAERDGQVLVDVPGFADRPLVTCETVEFDLTVVGFFTPR